MLRFSLTYSPAGPRSAVIVGSDQVVVVEADAFLRTRVANLDYLEVLVVAKGVLESLKGVCRLTVRTREAHIQVEPVRQHGAEGAAAGDYMCVYAVCDSHVLRGTMRRLEELLDPETFVRTECQARKQLRKIVSFKQQNR